MNAAKRLEIFRRLHEDNPEPKTELAYSSPFELLIAVILSAQSTDVGVNKATAKLYPVANTPAAIHALGVEGLSEYIKTIGLFNSKAKNVIETCRLLVERHGGEVPQTMDELHALAGVGRKTANVVLGNAFDINVGVVVDTHVQRLSTRLGLTKETTPEKIETDLMKLIPQEDWTLFSHWLIWHGRRRCFAKKPDCANCEVLRLCPSGKVFLRTGQSRSTAADPQT